MGTYQRTRHSISSSQSQINRSESLPKNINTHFPSESFCYWHKREPPSKREHHLRSCSHQTGLWASLWSIFSIRDCGSTQTTVAGATLGQVELGWIWKQAELAMRNRLVSSAPPWPLCQLLPPPPWFLPWLPGWWTNGPFPHQVVFVNGVLLQQ